MTPELHDKLVKALEIAHDLAITELDNANALYGRYPKTKLGMGRRIIAAEQDVQTINEALALLEKEYG